MTDGTGRVPLETGRLAEREALLAFADAVDGLDGWALLGPSRCYGWSRLDLVVHVVFGLQEFLCGLVTPAAGEPLVDADSFWSAFGEGMAEEDPVAQLVAQRRRTAAYAGPAEAIADLRRLTAASVHAVDALADRRLAWWGLSYEAGDYLAVWALEACVHHLDLLTDAAAPDSALALTRRVVVRRAAARGAVVPDTAPDEEVALVGSGRLPVPGSWGVDASLFPVVA